jgi:hypothetical protein
MKYSKEQLDTAIDRAGLPENHCSALRGLVELRGQPLFLGYFVQIVGVLLLALSGYFIYLMIRVVSFHSDLPSAELSTILEPCGKAGGLVFLLSLLVLQGADHYLNRIRHSRAVCELLMKQYTANHTSEDLVANRSESSR